MTFGSTFGRVFSPTFQPKSQASGRNTWWDLNGTLDSCVLAYQPKGAASYAASKVNLTGNTDYDATNGTAYPDWDATNGWKFNGSDDYVDSGYIPVAGLTVLVRVSNYTAVKGAVLGILDGEIGVEIGIETDRFFVYHPIANTISHWGTESGVFAALYKGANYWNGTNLNDNTPNTGTFPTLTSPLTIGGVYDESISAWYMFDGYVQAVAIYNAALTEQNIVDLTTAMNSI